MLIALVGLFLIIGKTVKNEKRPMVFLFCQMCRRDPAVFTKGATGNKPAPLAVNVQRLVRPCRSILFLSVYLIMTYRAYCNEIFFRVVTTLGMVFFMM